LHVQGLPASAQGASASASAIASDRWPTLALATMAKTLVRVWLQESLFVVFPNIQKWKHFSRKRAVKRVG